MTAGHALVVGATSEIGAAIAERLLECGFTVTGWGRSEERLAALTDRTRGPLVTDRVDVTDDTAVVAALERLDGRVQGRDPLRAVVWSAGLFDWAPADQADPTTWSRLLDVNLTAAARLTPRVLSRLRRATPSTLIYIASGAAHRVFPGNAAYVASKHGLAALAGAAFLDVRRHGVRVSVVSPGLVAAGAGLWSPLGRTAPERLLTPEDVAGAVEYVVTFPGHGCPVLVELQPLAEEG
jgi:NADP-dependent 3-hydroxy acid dehydrogenase YdfG